MLLLKRSWNSNESWNGRCSTRLSLLSVPQLRAAISLQALDNGKSITCTYSFM